MNNNLFIDDCFENFNLEKISFCRIIFNFCQLGSTYIQSKNMYDNYFSVVYERVLANNLTSPLKKTKINVIRRHFVED